MNATESFDVFVAGGGSAGLAAAVAAARTGARTLLVERHGSLGGMASAALVHSVCGLYRLPWDKNQPAELANGGFAAEFARRLLATGGAQGPVRLGRVDILLHRPAAFARLADVVARETPSLTVRLHTEIVDVAADTVRLSCRGVSQAVRVGTWVDATGDGVLATLRGARSEMAACGHLQRPAFIFAVGGVDPRALEDDGRLRLARRIVGAVREGALPPGLLGAHFRASPQPGEAFVTIDLSGGERFDPLDPACLTHLETDGREMGEKLVDFLRVESSASSASSGVPNLSKVYVSAWPSRAGVRESRRVVGRYRIETEDVEVGRSFEDEVAYAAWPMELRETNLGPKLRFPTGESPCGIPLRALRVPDDDTLFVAGRCVSCSHEAQASLRVIGTCLATGEAAGVAAALQQQGKPCDAGSVRTARDRLART